MHDQPHRNSGLLIREERKKERKGIIGPQFPFKNIADRVARVRLAVFLIFWGFLNACGESRVNTQT